MFSNKNIDTKKNIFLNIIKVKKIVAISNTKKLKIMFH